MSDEAPGTVAPTPSAWTVIEATRHDDDWTVTEALPLGDGHLVRTVWRHRLGGERLDGSAVVFVAGGVTLPERPLAIEDHSGEGRS